MLLLLAVLVRVLLWAVSAPRTHFEYMVSGTVAAAILLTLVYLVAVKRQVLPGFRARRVRRSGQSA